MYETHFPKFTSPEILRMPIEGIVLQMKAMNIDSVINFPFPTPPEKQALAKAEKVLVNLGALTVPSTAEKVSKRTGSTRIINRAGTSRITELGNSMSLFPLSPRFSKMLVIGQQHGCLPYVIAIVSVLSVGDPFLHAGAIGFGGAEGGDDEQNADDIVADADGAGAEIEHITSEEVKAKELRKLQRQAFYKAQQVSRSEAAQRWLLSSSERHVDRRRADPCLFVFSVSPEALGSRQGRKRCLQNAQRGRGLRV